MDTENGNELQTEADDLAPLSKREAEVMGRQTTSRSPGEDPVDQTVYADTGDSVESEEQSEVHNAGWKDIV